MYINYFRCKGLIWISSRNCHAKPEYDLQIRNTDKCSQALTNGLQRFPSSPMLNTRVVTRYALTVRRNKLAKLMLPACYVCYLAHIWWSYTNCLTKFMAPFTNSSGNEKYKCIIYTWGQTLKVMSVEKSKIIWYFFLGNYIFRIKLILIDMLGGNS